MKAWVMQWLGQGNGFGIGLGLGFGLGLERAYESEDLGQAKS